MFAHITSYDRATKNGRSCIEQETRHKGGMAKIACQSQTLR